MKNFNQAFRAACVAMCLLSCPSPGSTQTCRIYCPDGSTPLIDCDSSIDPCRSSRGAENPGYDEGAGLRAREAAEAAKRETERLERERLAEEKRKKAAEFIRNRDVAVSTLKGSNPALNQLKGISSTDSSSLKGSGFDSGTGLKMLRGSDPLKPDNGVQPTLYPDASVVDARKVPTGLPTSVEKAIPLTPAGDRVRKGFQSISAHDWKGALAWFQDALNHEPGSSGIKRLVDLAEFTLQQQAATAKPARPATAKANGKPVKTAEIAKGDEFQRSLNEYYKKHPPKFLKFVKPRTQTDEEWLNEKEPAWKNFFRMLAPRLKVNENGNVIAVGIRG